jgi:cyclophilin family peptidyl-prolyl cis-trans isomerase
MQQELDSENPELSIRILGVNELGHDADNALMTAGGDLPWLQDIDDDGNGSSDTWDSWDVTFRDVIITDSTNVQVAVYNLTNNDLASADNYSTLKQLLIDSASDTSDPEVELAAILDQTVQAGSPLHIPLNGLDPTGGQLTFSVESSDSLVTAEVLEGNRSLRMQVDDFGAMTFELFESRAPRPTSRMIELAESEFFTDTIFHRVINNFVIQGGDPTGTGSGGSTLGDFDDQFHVDLQHNRTGLLSMAKTTDDTNDSQFFITEGPTRHLDFNHSIFGVLTEGEDVRAAISDVATDGGDRPLDPVVLHEVEIFEDLENGVLVLSAAEGSSGSATITVTVSDSLGNQASRSFETTVVTDGDSNADGNPFLDDIAPLRMEANSVASFQLTAQDAEGETDIEFLGESDLAAQLSASQMPTLPSGLDYNVDSTTGELTITASEGLVGVHQVRVGVRKLGTFGSDSTIDSQLVSVTLGVVTVDANDHSSGTQASDGTPDTISLRKTGTGTDYEVSVNGELVRTLDESLVHAIDLVGSSDDDLFVIDCANGPPMMPGGLVITGGSQQTSDGDSLQLTGGNFDSVTHRFTSASSGSITIETNAPISYSGLEPISDTLLSDDRVFEFGDGDDQVTVGDDSDNANGISRISSAGTSETVDFQMTPLGRITIRTGAGDDQLTALDLDPTVVSSLTIGGEQGNDSLDASAMTDPVTVTGGSGDDSLTGGSGDDVLNGQAGDDVVRGGAGDDALLGGSGRDLLDGGDGNDRLRAQGYSGDTLVGSSGSDLLSGGDGTDRVTVQGDTDITLEDAQLTVGSDSHQLVDIERAQLAGGAGSNTIDAAGFSGNTTLSGGLGADTLTGSSGIATLQELLDEDLTLTDGLLVGTETDTLVAIDRAKLVGGSSGNQFDTSGFSGPVTLRGSGGDDTMIGGAEDDLIFGGNGNDLIEARGGNDDVRAGSGHDTIDGGDGNDSIRAGAGHDSIVGSAGDDTLNGAQGRDTIEGGAGNDALSGLLGDDRLDGGVGTDTLVSGLGNDTLNGGDGDDVLLAGDGDDSLIGAGGIDVLAGHGGSNSFDDASEVNESFVFYAAWIDRV